MAPTLWQFIQDELGLRTADAQWDVRLPSLPAVVDAVFKTTDAAYLVEARSRPPDWTDMAQLVFLEKHASQSFGARAIKLVLAAPGFDRKTRALAKQTNIRLVEVPMELLPRLPESGLSITKPKAWRTVTTLLGFPRVPGIRDLSRASGTSPGWVSQIVRELQALQILTDGQEWRSEGLQKLLDRVASERPMADLEIKRIQTGIASWKEFYVLMTTQWSPAMASMKRPGIWVCGLTAGMVYSDDLIRHDRLDVYAHDTDGLSDLFRGQERGIEIRVYRPDRDVAKDSTIKDGLPTVSVAQALLDVAGFGYSARDTASKLVEVLRND